MAPDNTSNHDKKSVAAEVIGGDPSGSNTGVKPGEEPIIPRAADGTALGNDLAVPDLGSRPGEIDESDNRRLRASDSEQ